MVLLDLLEYFDLNELLEGLLCPRFEVDVGLLADDQFGLRELGFVGFQFVLERFAVLSEVFDLSDLLSVLHFLLLELELKVLLLSFDDHLQLLLLRFGLLD